VARVELVGAKRLGGNGHVLLLAARVGKTEIDELDFLVFDHFQHVGGRGHAGLLGNVCEGGRCVAEIERMSKS
jgi:hypothetical protein